MSRLSDENLASMERVWRASGLHDIPDAIAELRERRAADLSDEDTKALAWVRRRVNLMVNDFEAYEALSVLDRLLNARGSK